MPLRALLLLLVLLGPGSNRGLAETWEDGTKDYDYERHDGTDPPETLEDSTGAATPRPVMGTLGQRESARPGTPAPAPLEVTTGASAGLGAGGAPVGNLSTEMATQGVPVTPGPLPKEPVTTVPPITQAPSTELATTTALPLGPAATEALATSPAATEPLTTQPAATEALATQPAATEALATQPAATEAPSMESTVVETLSVGLAVVEALSTELAATAAPSREPAPTEALSKVAATGKALSLRPATTPLLVPSDPHRGTTVAAGTSSDAAIRQWKGSQGLSPPSSASPSPARGPDYMPVKHCLLAIFILALVATTFLVCTVVLAVRLSRKKHMYPVHRYSPTEMVCISALLPEGGEGPATTANGGPPPSKGPGLKEGAGEDRDGDDLTLHSFLP